MLQRMDKHKNDKHQRSYIVLVIGIICLSIGPILVKMTNAPGAVTSFYRMLISSVILGAITMTRTRTGNVQSCISMKENWRYLLFPVLAGFSSAIDHGFWSNSLLITSVNKATVLNNLSPLWVSLIALIIFKEKFQKKFWLGLLFVIVGVFGVSNLFTEVNFRNFNIGDLFALFSSFFYAGYFTFTEIGRRKIPVMLQMLISVVCCTVGLGMIVALLNNHLTGYSLKTYLSFFLLALIPQLGGYYCLTYALGYLPASFVSPMVEIKPILSTFIAWIVLHETVSVKQLIFSIVLLIGIHIINLARIKPLSLQ